MKGVDAQAVEGVGAGRLGGSAPAPAPGNSGEAQLPAIFETTADGACAQIGGRPPQRVGDEARKVVLAIFGALDLATANEVRLRRAVGQRHPATALWVLGEFAEIVRCFDADFARLLTPDNTAAETPGGRS